MTSEQCWQRLQDEFGITATGSIDLSSMTCQASDGTFLKIPNFESMPSNAIRTKMYGIVTNQLIHNPPGYGWY